MSSSVKTAWTPRAAAAAGIDRADRGMSMWAAHEARMEEARKLDIVDKAGAPCQERLVLDASDTLSDQVSISGL